jgi:oligoribonuclease
MKYISIDIETTGLDPFEHKIIEFGALLEDTNKTHIPVSELPHYHCIIQQERKGDPRALEMNHHIFEIMETGWCVSQGAFLKDLFYWCSNCDLPKNEKGKIRIVAAGKNFSLFDLLFLNQIPGFAQLFSISHRYLDPAMLYMQASDTELPDLQTCLDRAGIKKTVAHNALSDAADVINLLRQKYMALNLVGPA